MRSTLRTILAGTFVVGVLDITEVILFYAFRDVKPIRILQSVAAGLLGRPAATSGGWRTAILGLALHFFIAGVVVTVYVLASRKIGLLVRHPILMGAAYGLAVCAFMQYVVLPMSATSGGMPRSWIILANLLFAHVFCVGIPSALVAAHGLRSGSLRRSAGSPSSQP